MTLSLGRYFSRASARFCCIYIYAEKMKAAVVIFTGADMHGNLSTAYFNSILLQVNIHLFYLLLNHSGGY